MTKMSLKQKIEQVGFWTFGFIFWYLVIAFFLKSNYPIYNYKLDPSEAYNVIKDALGLAAAFLVPVTAFVLFSDWREPYVQKSIEDDSSKIYDGINNAINTLIRIKIEIDDDSNFNSNDDSKVTKLITELSEKREALTILNEHLKSRGDFVIEFTGHAKHLLDKIKYVILDLGSLCTQQLKIQNPETHNDLNDSDQNFAENEQVKFNGIEAQILEDFLNLREVFQKVC